MSFSHLDEKGRAHMVNVHEKSVTRRMARAAASIYMPPALIEAVKEQTIAKGDVLSVAQIAAVMGAKKTSDLIPMCHPLLLESVDVDFEICSDRIIVIAEVGIEAKTGVEMEALTAVNVAALTIYDMCKSMGHKMTIGEIKLISKSGGKSDYFLGEAKVVSVNISEKKGTVKTPVASIEAKEGLGITGDAHSGMGNREVSLLARESIIKVEKSIDKRLEDGSFAENITTEGLVLHTLPLGTILQIGETRHRISQIGKSCHAGCEISKLSGDCVMPKEGVFSRVLKGGSIRPGDGICVL